MNYKKYFTTLFLIIALIFMGISFPAFAKPQAPSQKIHVVTSSEDLESITKAIAGDKADVTSIGKGYQNPHFVPPKPSFMLKLKDANLLVEIGMELEVWLNPLVEGSRNSRIYKNAPGFVDASYGVPVLGSPASKIDRSLGDVHPFGNPHYWLDPVNAKYISANITEGLIRVDPDNAAYYEAHHQIFLKQLAHEITGWINRAKPLRGVHVITYHESWTYFANRFGLDVVGTIEPKPGIPPTPKHTQWLIETAQKQHVKFIMVEPYYNHAVADQVAKASGAKVVIVPPSVGGASGADNYFTLFDTILNLLLQ